MSNDRMANPSAHFDAPADVLADDSLSRADKLDILTNWANEIRQLQVAEEENMRGQPGQAEQLEAVERALLSLGADDAAHDAKA